MRRTINQTLKHSYRWAHDEIKYAVFCVFLSLEDVFLVIHHSKLNVRTLLFATWWYTGHAFQQVSFVVYESALLTILLVKESPFTIFSIVFPVWFLVLPSNVSWDRKVWFHANIIEWPTCNVNLVYRNSHKAWVFSSKVVVVTKSRRQLIKVR